MAYIGMAYIGMALYRYGLYSYGRTTVLHPPLDVRFVVTAEAAEIVERQVELPRTHEHAWVCTYSRKHGCMARTQTRLHPQSTCACVHPCERMCCVAGAVLTSD